MHQPVLNMLNLWHGSRRLLKRFSNALNLILDGIPLNLQERELEEQRESAAAEAARLGSLLHEEVGRRERERISTKEEASRLSELLEEERAARDEEASRRGSVHARRRRPLWVLRKRRPANQPLGLV